MKIQFTKMHGLGNDYIFVDGSKHDLGRLDLGDFARKICHRNLGVGADGVISVFRTKKGSPSMRIYNSDGTEAQMCGNGVVCCARYLYEQGLCRKTKQEIKTKAGLIEAEITESKDPFRVRVNLGQPVLLRNRIPLWGTKEFCINDDLRVKHRVFKFTAISTGNPHAVIFVREFDKHWQTWGKLIENHPLFPEKTNVEFVKILNARRISLRVWERGAGATLACGTGACAAVVAGILNGKLSRKVRADFAYGQLQIEWHKPSDCLFMTGCAQRICDGSYDYKPVLSN